MKLALIVPTRGRPRLLQASMTAFDELASGEHEIVYAICCDEDDNVTRCAAEALQHDINAVTVCAPRPLTIGKKMNDAARSIEADAYLWINDDTFPLTQYWDAALADVFEQHRLPIFCWANVHEPAGGCDPVISKRYMEAVGRMLPEHFPFWFADTWVQETYLLAFGEQIATTTLPLLGGRRGKTTGMRDLPFWFEFFAATRIERIEEAQRIADAYGLDVRVAGRGEILAGLAERDRWQLGRCAQYQQLWGDTREPSESYIKAKTQAQDWLATHI